MAKPGGENADESANPSTPKAQGYLKLHPESQASSADVCVTPKATSAPTSSANSDAGRSDEIENHVLHSSEEPSPSASTSSMHANPAQHCSPTRRTTPSDNTKEAWKKRKQVLLAEARNQVPANLQLHGLRPPPPHSDIYVGLGAPSLTRHTDQLIAAPSGSSSGVGLTAAHAPKHSAILPWRDPQLRNDMMRIIQQFLEEEGMERTTQVLAEEWGGKKRESDQTAQDARHLKEAILAGAWHKVDSLLETPLVRRANAFRYSVYKQQYLELIESREYSQAFSFMNERLRELEHYQPFAGEFRDLCYLLSSESFCLIHV